MVTAPVRIGSYRIERLLGIGSFATVWLGYDASLGARVAIKVLAENWSHDLRVHERFLDEGRMLWSLDHERIVRVHALGELADGRPYLVMGWADGGSLRDRLALAPIGAGPALRLLREIAAGVAVLHDHGIVHRDLTPGNVLFRSCPPGADRVVIADLGLAKAIAAASGLTARAGTPGYMAPEQDDPLAIVDRRADVYGLGRLGFRLLSAAPRAARDAAREATRDAARGAARGPAPGAARGASPDGAPGRSGQPVRLLDGVPPAVAAVLRRATAPLPADRYDDATAFLAALDRATSARPAGRGRTAAVLAATAAAIVALLASDSVGGRFTGRPGLAVDAAGRLAIATPPGWHARAGEWTGPVGAKPGPALVISPDPDRWPTDPTLPGAFVWVSGGGGSRERFLAGRPHAPCTAEPVRSSAEWLIAGFSACPGARVAIVEAARAGPAGSGVVYVQIGLPASPGPAFVDSLLAGVRVR